MMCKEKSHVKKCDDKMKDYKLNLSSAYFKFGALAQWDKHDDWGSKKRKEKKIDSSQMKLLPKQCKSCRRLAKTHIITYPVFQNEIFEYKILHSMPSNVP